jgi:hypothetical protein
MSNPDEGREVVEIVARALAKYEGISYATYRQSCDDQAHAILTAIEASGWKIVPVEIDRRMADAGSSAYDHPSVYMGGPSEGGRLIARRIWKAMLSASPKATGGALSQTDGAEPTPPKVRTP